MLYAADAAAGSGGVVRIRWAGPGDPAAHLAAGWLLTTWTVALIEAHRTYREGRDAKTAKAAFLAFVDKGTIGTKAALAGTPYA